MPVPKVVPGATSVAVTGTAGVLATGLPFSASGDGVGVSTNSAVSVTGGVFINTTIVYSCTTITATPSIEFSATYFV